jgi:beta-phosphoglucomutase-like phosphatase (HAD superfamily)
MGGDEPLLDSRAVNSRQVKAENHAMSETNGEQSTWQQDSKSAISRDRYDAVLLDLDGVITDTASIHAACWKQMFDEYLQKRATQRGEAFHPFEIATDYRLYVDGKPRYDGVRDFLTSPAYGSPKEVRTTPRRPKQLMASGTEKTIWLTKSSKTKGSSLTRAASDSSVISVIRASKSPSSPRARTARRF